MRTNRYAIVTVQGEGASHFDLARAAEFSGMHAEMILEFVRAQLVNPLRHDAAGEPVFDESEALRLRHIEHLRRAERVNLRTICYIVRLLDRLDATESELRSLRERLR